MANSITIGKTLSNWLIAPFMSNQNVAYFMNTLKALMGDVVLVCTPSTETVSHSAPGFPLAAIVSLQTVEGTTHQWYNGPVDLAITQSSSAGTASIVPTAGSNMMVDGQLSVAISGSGTWANGTKQVTTATAAGTVTGSGNASVVVTAAALTGSPKTYSVPVVSGNTPALVAAAIATVLAADTVLSALYTVTNPTGASTTIVLTAVSGKANDSTLNVAIATGTATGITTAASSAATTAGVAADTITLTASKDSSTPLLSAVSNATAVITMS